MRRFRSDRGLGGRRSKASISLCTTWSRRRVGSASDISVYLPAYINLPKLSVDYPEPLPPFRKPFDLMPGQNRPIWIDVNVAKNAKPGDYKGVITIAPANGSATQVPFTLHVYGFTLPVESKLATAFGIYPEMIAEKHSVSPASAEAKTLHKSKRPASAGSRHLHIQHPRRHLYRRGSEGPAARPPYDELRHHVYARREEQRRILDRVRSLGALDKGIFYFVDEPINKDAYKALQDGLQLRARDRAEGNIVSPYYGNPHSQDQEHLRPLGGLHQRSVLQHGLL